MIKVGIIDDHKIIIEGLERFINESNKAKVVGKAYKAAESWKVLAFDKPDVLLLDISLPDINGIELCKEIKKKYPQVKILMLTSFGELSTITRALDAGADGYVLRNSMPEELLEGIQTVTSGSRFLCEEAGMILKKNKNNPLELTRREMELLQLIVQGYTLPELVDKMCLGYHTVRSYRKNLNIKLDAHNTAQLIQNAKALQLV